MSLYTADLAQSLNRLTQHSINLRFSASISRRESSAREGRQYVKQCAIQCYVGHHISFDCHIDWWCAWWLTQVERKYPIVRVRSKRKGSVWRPAAVVHRQRRANRPLGAVSGA